MATKEGLALPLPAAILFCVTLSCFCSGGAAILVTVS